MEPNLEEKGAAENKLNWRDSPFKQEGVKDRNLSCLFFGGNDEVRRNLQFNRKLQRILSGLSDRYRGYVFSLQHGSRGLSFHHFRAFYEFRPTELGLYIQYPSDGYWWW